VDAGVHSLKDHAREASPRAHPAAITGARKTRETIADDGSGRRSRASEGGARRPLEPEGGEPCCRPEHTDLVTSPSAESGHAMRKLDERGLARPRNGP